jgi:Protein of unknown function (DUF551)
MDWINTKAKLPKDGQRVIGFFPTCDESGYAVAPAYRCGYKVVSDYPNSTAHMFEASFWMPYPNPPQLTIN